jgi:hypothetical protein
MELTKEHFDQIVSELARKKDMAHLATSVEMKQLDARVADVEETLAEHTTIPPHFR